MSETAGLLISLVGGLLLGAFFFGGLRWTVHKGLQSAKPGVWFLGSLVFRVVVTVGGFYLVTNGDWKRALMCMIGFIAMRVFFVWSALREKR